MKYISFYYIFTFLLFHFHFFKQFINVMLLICKCKIESLHYLSSPTHRVTEKWLKRQFYSIPIVKNSLLSKVSHA